MRFLCPRHYQVGAMGRNSGGRSCDCSGQSNWIVKFGILELAFARAALVELLLTQAFSCTVECKPTVKVFLQ
jgi:hypothetical protein